MTTESTVGTGWETGLVTPDHESISSPAQAASKLHAWVDESIHTPGPEAPEGMYVLAAAIADSSDCDGTRETLRGLVVGRQQRLHWGKEDTSQREKITSAIAASGLTSVVVVGVSLDARNQERARRKCLEKLLWELAPWEISTVWLESRTTSLNRHDLKLVDAWRSQGKLPSTLRIEIGLPSTEPMLWIPDAVAGAVAAARKGSSAHRDKLGDMVLEVEFDL